MIVEGVDLDLTGLTVQPGHINAHDHLEFALFPRLGKGPYPNATAWARDIYHPDRPPVSEHLRVAKEERLLWGGLRNLLAGVTTVSHHNPYEPVFDDDFPVRVVRRYGWAHSLAFADDVVERYAATPGDAPFLIHAAEGTDDAAAREIQRLDELGVLRENTVLVHATTLDSDSAALVRRRGTSIVWCPRSNLFTLGRTLTPPKDVPVALGTDSSLTTEGDFLDELCAARRMAPGFVNEPERVLRLDPQPDDWIAVPAPGHPPKLVVIGGRVHLIDPELAPRELPAPFYPLEIAGRPPVLTRWNPPRRAGMKLAGREVLV